MNVNIVTKVDLQAVYKDKPLSFLNLNSLGSPVARNQNILTGEDVIVEIVERLGPYTIIKFSHIFGINSLIVPTDIIKTKEIPEAIVAFTPVLDSYHKDHWYYDRVQNRLFIHYPELTITNNFGNTHTITDLIVMMVLRPTYQINMDLYGARISFTTEELHHGYIHSHLHISDYVFTTFCKGLGSEFAVIMSSLNKFNTPDQFEVFLTQLKKYLEWESLEGQPYISINKLHSVLEDVTDMDVGGGDGVVLAELAVDAVKKLALPDNLKYLHRVRNFFLLRVDELFYEFEKSIITDKVFERLSRGLYGNYDEENARFLAEQADTRYSYGINDIPEPDSVMLEIMGKLNLTRRIVDKTTAVKKVPTRKRLKSKAIRYFINSVNRILLDGLKVTINDRINGSTQSTRNDNSTVSVTDFMPAQPVPAE